MAATDHPRSLQQPLQVWLALLMMVGALAACAPTTPVQIPPAWQSSPKSAAAAPSQKPRQILKPAPKITEQNIPAQTPSQTTSSGQPPAAVSSPPQQLASMQLVGEAQAAMSQGHIDEAINTLEQAIQVDVYNGQAFYDLALAWQSKGSQTNALQFANKAEVLFQNHPAKLKQLYLLKAQLYQALGDTAKAQAYRQKAARF